MQLNLITSYIIVTVVLMVQLTSMNFSGSESSGEILVALTLSGVSTRNNTVMISLNGMTATGHKNHLKSSHALVHIKCTP